MPHQASGSPVGVGRVHLPRLWPCAQVCPSLNRTRRPSIKSGQLNTPDEANEANRQRPSLPLSRAGRSGHHLNQLAGTHPAPSFEGYDYPMTRAARVTIVTVGAAVRAGRRLDGFRPARWG